jgi:hypothetical protein
MLPLLGRRLQPWMNAKVFLPLDVCDSIQSQYQNKQDWLQIFIFTKQKKKSHFFLEKFKSM